MARIARPAFLALLALASATIGLAGPDFSQGGYWLPPRRADFLVAPNSGGGLWAWSIATADLDLDGDIDYVTADIDEQLGGVPAYASVVLNNGDGTFGEPASYAVGEAPRCVVLADFSADGFPDIAVSDTWNDRVSILKSKGDGTFLPAVHYSATWTAYDLAPGDFNADGAIDLAVAGEADTSIKILRNNGLGGFTTANTLNLGSTGCTLATGDVNQDGKLDIVAADSSSLGVKVFRNLGTTFAPYVLYPAGNGYFSDVKVADFDLDGWVDIVANGGNTGFWLWRNNGTGVFSTPKVVGSSSGWEMEVGDFDGDGWPDLACGNYLSNSVSVLLNDRTGAFLPRVDWGTTDQPRSIAVGDFDGDDRLDVVAASAGSDARWATLLFNIGAGKFHARRDYPLIGDVNDVVLGDLDNDGEVDAGAAVYVPNLNRLGLLWGLGDATFEEPQYTPHWGNMQPTGLALGDLDMDGWLDVAVSVFSPGNGVLVLRNQHDRTFTAPVLYAAGGNPSDVAIGDLNGDGWPDLVVSNGPQSSIHVYFNHGNGTFAAGIEHAVGFKPNGLAIGDWDRDGDRDVVVTNLTSAVNLMYNSGLGSLSRVDHFIGTSQATPELVDVDHDGWLDVVFTTGWVTLLRNDRSGGFGAPEVSLTPAGGTVVADFNQDGHLDAAGVDGVRSEVYVGLGDGAGAFIDSGRFWEVGYHPGRMAAGDLDHDALPELLTANVTGRSVTVLENLARRVFLK